MSSSMFPIPGSQLTFQGTLIHQADPFQEIEFTVRFRKNPKESITESRTKVAEHAIVKSPSQRKYLVHEELARLVSPSDQAFQETIGYFKTFNLKKSGEQLISRTVSFKGSIANINRAFMTTLGVFQGPNRFTFLAYSGELKLPADVLAHVEKVSGISALLKSEFRLPSQLPQPDDVNGVKSMTTQPKGYTTPQLAKAYDFPKTVKGKGQCIGIIELGGAYKQSDIDAYFKSLDLPSPKIIEVGTPINDSNVLNNSEITLDLQIAGAVAPKANLVVYYGDTILEAMRLVVADEKNNPSVVSISWAGSERNYSMQDVAELNEVFFEAALLGITVIAASGDHGAYNQQPQLNVSIPSSNPLVLGCGGTAPVLGDNNNITSDKIWNQDQGKIGSGGGFSYLYPSPSYQKTVVATYPYASPNRRGVPDVAANSDGVTGYRVIFNGIEMSIGGTSAATPLIAGLIALLNEELGYRLGFTNEVLYSLVGSNAFESIVIGDNGYYPATNSHWNPGAGLGTPRGNALLAALKKLEKTVGSPAKK